MSSLVPPSLLELPEPWRNLQATPTYVGEDSGTVEEALEALERCLRALEKLPSVPRDQLPEDILLAWGLWTASLATDMPSFDVFQLEPIAESVRAIVPGSTDALIETCALAWLRDQAMSVANGASIVLVRFLEAEPRPDLQNALLDIVDRYWRVDQTLTYRAFLCLKDLDPVRALDSLEKIAVEPDASDSLKELYAGRERWISPPKRDP